MKRHQSCSDRMCGAEDCPKCHPENFCEGVYFDDWEENIEPDEDDERDARRERETE